MMIKHLGQARHLIKAALREDVGPGDLTTKILIPNALFGEAQIIAKGRGILCGGAIIKEVFKLLDPNIQVKQKISDGKAVSHRTKVFTIRGRIASILKGERVALNFLGRFSGIATLTNQFVHRVKGTRAKIYDTRKTTPLWRELEKYAVKTGGGENHRFGLWDEILVKDNHWFAIRGILEETHCRYFSQRIQKFLKRRNFPIEVEVANVRELVHLLEGTFLPDRILLDNFSISELRRAVSIVHRKKSKVLLEASGGITLRNVRQVAKAGVDQISVGALTHSAPTLDFSLKLVKVS